MLNPKSLTNGDRAFYYHSETEALSLVEPAEGVKDEVQAPSEMFVRMHVPLLRSSAESLAVGGAAVPHSRAAFGASSLFGPAPCVRAGPSIEEDVTGKVAVVSRAEGAAAERALNCTDMALRAQERGAVGVIAINSEVTGMRGAAADPEAAQITIPVVCLASAFALEVDGAEAELAPTEKAAALLAEAAALSPSLNPQSPWLRYTNGGLALYWHIETDAFSLVEPVDGVCNEEEESDLNFEPTGLICSGKRAVRSRRTTRRPEKS